MVSADLIQAVSQLITSLFWPVVVSVLLLYFGPPIRRFLKQSKQATVSGMGFEATFERNMESALLYGLSVAEKSELSDQLSEDQIDELLAEVGTYLEPSTQDELSKITILWVDDNPDNNMYERETFESLGVNVELSRSTSDAIEKIKSRNYDVVISDMGRPESDRAGYDLLERKQSIGDSSPFIIYSGPVRPEHKRMAREKGAFGCTDRPRELYSLVRRALGGNMEFSDTEDEIIHAR